MKHKLLLPMFCCNPINNCISDDGICSIGEQQSTLRRLADYPENGALVKVAISKEQRIFQTITQSHAHPPLQAAACCHSLTRIDNIIRGDPLDMVLMAETQWTLHEPQNDENTQYDRLIPTVLVSPEDEYKQKCVSWSKCLFYILKLLFFINYRNLVL
jgi:hypothetical protein